MDNGATRATWGPFFPMSASRALTSIMAFRWPHVAPWPENGGFLRFGAAALGPARGPIPPLVGEMWVAALQMYLL